MQPEFVRITADLGRHAFGQLTSLCVAREQLQADQRVRELIDKSGDGQRGDGLLGDLRLTAVAAIERGKFLDVPCDGAKIDDFIGAGRLH